jgi:hypothetical protein
MKKNMYFLNTALAVVLGTALLAAVLVRTFGPIIIIPPLNIPNMVLLSLVALLADHYLSGGAKRCYICIPVLSALTFGLLPFAACFVGVWDALKLGVVGGVVFTVVTVLFTSIQDRLSSGPDCKAAPVLSAFGLYLAAQCFMGIVL